MLRISGAFQLGVCIVCIILTLSLVQGTVAASASKQAPYDVTIRYTGMMTGMIQTGYGPVFPTGNDVFLIITYQIQNHVDREFYTNPNNFFVIVNSVQYGYSANSFELPNMLSTVSLLNGGSVAGSLAFEVPVGTTSYTPTYQWITSFNIQWISG